MSLSRSIEQRAANWLAHREQPDWTPARETELQAWLDESLANKAAFWRLEAGWRAADRLAATRTDRNEGQIRGRPPFHHLWAVAAALLIMCTASLGIWQFASDRRDDSLIRIATAVGVHKNVALSDGSKVTAKTASLLRALFAHGQRQVWLDRGEAYFEVAHDRRHPFVVLAGAQKVTVLGTKFSVRRNGDTVTVAVVEGRVRVEDSDPNTADRAAIITAGDVAIARGHSMLIDDRSEQRVQDGLAWRQGMLVFDQVTLEQAADEFNRYNRRQIRLGDTQAGRIRIGGSFDATGVDAFTRLLHDAFGLRVVNEGNDITIKS